MARIVLDASALLISINQEPGCEVVSAVLEGAVISSVNAAEVATKLAIRGADEASIETVFASHRIAIELFDKRRAVSAGLLVIQTRHRGLSLADRACLALAKELDLPVMTADRAWRDLELGIEMRFAR